jgi:dimethylaniline monooxygenase (N-oxide forming)
VNQPTSVVVQSEPLDAIRSGEVVKIYRHDITTLSDSNVILDDGSSLRTDLLIYATGYHNIPALFSASDAAHLGLPVPASDISPAEKEKWCKLDAQADAHICRLFPRLADPPTTTTTTYTFSTRQSEFTPHRLYRTILPPSLLEVNDRSFVVVGAIATSATGIVAEAVALWAVAWLTGHLDVKVKGRREQQNEGNVREAVENEIALGNAFKARRYLNLGRRTPTVMYEWLSVRPSRCNIIFPPSLFLSSLASLHIRPEVLM